MARKLESSSSVARSGQSRNAGLQILEELLGSRSRARLLTMFVTHPTDEFYAQRLTSVTGLAESTLRYELRRLEQRGLVVGRREGREKYYRINDRHPLFPELKRMVYKTAGFGDILREAVRGVSGVKAAFIFGSVAKGGERAVSDVDLFVLGKPDQTKLAAALREAEQRLGREVNLVVMGLEEWRRRRNAGEGFIDELIRSQKIHLVGDEHSLRGT